MDAEQADPDFIRFVDPKYGIRAIMRIIETYYNKYLMLNIHDMISRWAPDTENDTGAYINDVAAHLGVDPSDQLTLDAGTLIALAQAIALHENGKPLSGQPANWYNDSVYQAAHDLA